MGSARPLPGTPTDIHPIYLFWHCVGRGANRRATEQKAGIIRLPPAPVQADAAATRHRCMRFPGSKPFSAPVSIVTGEPEESSPSISDGDDDSDPACVFWNEPGAVAKNLTLHVCSLTSMAETLDHTAFWPDEKTLHGRYDGLKGRKPFREDFHYPGGEPR